MTATAGTLTSSAVLTVANVAPYNVTAVPSRPTVDEGSGVTVTGGFSDPGADRHPSPSTGVTGTPTPCRSPPAC